MKMTIFTASVNPNYYDLVELSGLDFDGAVEFFKNDEICASTCNTIEVDLTQPNEGKFWADGADLQDGSDTLFVWYKVTD